MHILKFTDRMFWMAAREGKITGSRLGDVVTLRGNGKKLAFYELIAEALGVPADGEDPMARGTRLEKDAMARFEEATGKKLDTSLLMWAREDNQRIAVSPDGVVIAKAKKDENTEAVEAKCLKSALHIKAIITKEVPDEYWFQGLQYFAVNDKLKKLHFVFFDPRFSMFKDPKDKTAALDFFVLELTRDSFLIEEKKGEPKVDQIKKYLDYQKTIFAEVDEIVTKFSF